MRVIYEGSERDQTEYWQIVFEEGASHPDYMDLFGVI